MAGEALDSLIDRVADLIIRAKKTIVFSGAGISTESGLPDFRSPGGIWGRFDPDDFSYQRFIKDVNARKKLWQLIRGLALAAEPNEAHYAIAELYRMGKLDCVITQNVDNLHQKAGLPGDRVFELHGSMQSLLCLGCGRRYPFDRVKARLDEVEEIPDCERCHGLLKPAAVFFGEPLPQKVLKEASLRSSRCDLFIVVGSTLVIYPAAYLPDYAVTAGAKLVIINLSTTPMDHKAEVLLRAGAGATMGKIVKRVKEKL